MKLLKIIYLLLLVAFVTVIIADIHVEKYWHTPFMLLAIYLTASHLWNLHKEDGGIKFGKTRIVYLIGPYAFKFPVVSEWRLFIMGLVGNMQETNYARNINLQDKLCPVYFSILGGFMNIMPRCSEVTEEDFPDWWDFEEWSMYDIVENNEYYITVNGLPVENKLSSFGKLHNGNIVAVDFGSWDRITTIKKAQNELKKV